MTIEDLSVKMAEGFLSSDKKLDSFGKRFDAKLENLAMMTAKGFENVDKRFEAVDERFESIDERFESMDKKFEAVDKRFDGVDARLDKVESRLFSVEDNQLDLKLRFEVFEKHHIPAVENLKSRVVVLERRVGVKM